MRLSEIYLKASIKIENLSKRYCYFLQGTHHAVMEVLKHNG